MQEMQETWVQSLGRKDPLEKEMATHSSILAWEIPWTEEPGRLQSIGSQRVGHNWSDFTYTHWVALSGCNRKFLWPFSVYLFWMAFDPSLHVMLESNSHYGLKRNENWHQFVSFRVIIRVKVPKASHDDNMSIVFVSKSCFSPKSCLITIVLWACSSTLTVMYAIKTALKMLQVGRGIPVYPYISFIEFSKLLTPLFLYICSRGPEEAKWLHSLYNHYCCYSNYTSQPFAVLQLRLPLLFILCHYL